MKSDPSFLGWICLGKFRLLVAGSVGFLVLVFVVTVVSLNANGQEFRSLLQMPLLLCSLLIPLYAVRRQRRIFQLRRWARASCSLVPCLSPLQVHKVPIKSSQSHRGLE